MARSSNVLPAVQRKLNTQIDVIALTIACDFDPVREGGERGMSPARPAILGDVLVELVSQAALPIDIVPIPFVGNFIVRNVPVDSGDTGKPGR